MIMDGKVLQQAFQFAGSLGRFQGLVQFVRQNPDAYSHERLMEELFKVYDEEQAKIDALEAKFKELDEQ
jgi:uncharacterized protein YacL (UPF0231 family)